MKAKIPPDRLLVAQDVFAEDMCGNDLRKLITRVLNDDSAFDTYHNNALEIIAAGPDGILDLPQEQAEALVEALVVFSQVSAVLHGASAEQDLKIILKPGAIEAAESIRKTHGFLFVIDPSNQRKLDKLGESPEERTITVTVREEVSSWGYFIRQMMGRVESIDYAKSN